MLQKLIIPLILTLSFTLATAETYRLQTNWFAQAEHIGFYAAQHDGLYQTEGAFDIAITPGGPGVAGITLLVTGQTDFVMTDSASLLDARNQGAPVVAVFATFQDTPQGLMYHAENPVEDFHDLAGRTVAVGAGSPWWQFILKKYDLEGEVQTVNYSGTAIDWLHDKTRVTQIYITSEPFKVSQEDPTVEPRWLRVADSGFNPYSNLIAVTEDFLREKPEVVAAFVKASQEGWRRALANPDAYAQPILDANPLMTLEQILYSAKASAPLIDTDVPIGAMTLERWRTLHDQFLDLGLIRGEPDIMAVFRWE